MTENVHELKLDKKQTNDNMKEKSGWVSWLFFIISIAAVFFIFRFVIGITIINGDSMSPTISDGDVFLTSDMFYTPERNDIVIFRDEDGYDVIKRIIGLPNETIAIQNGVVFVDGEPIKSEFTTGIPNDMPERTVDSGSYFLIGDNRTPGESLDSRNSDIGSISKEKIKGQAILSLLPFGLMTIIPK
ncbi:signal peptidase I [Virgibacillus ihumii]|uniref:signal peptidase I n=1 Tax=Virgibacillus ihumii TaxID=2686091 RepID=UPI00157C1017|nr:signal peptidase I [Virgibacillus ihumii]